MLPWEANSEGERLITTQEIDLPLQAGPVKVVPYGLGELGRWGEDLDGDALERAYRPDRRAGEHADVGDLSRTSAIRCSTSTGWPTRWCSTPSSPTPTRTRTSTSCRCTIRWTTRRSPSSAAACTSGALPPTITDPKFDPRTYAIRNGLQNWVTSPSAEIADDLMALRMGVRQRWQTKRGPVGNQHIVDWLTLDMNATYFPDADRDNFGQELGLIDYDLRWHVGDRFTVLSDGFADVFGDGLKTVAGGVLINRPTRGNAYLGVRSINGPVTSNVLLGSYSYRLSEKWITTAGAAFDFADTGNIGQTFSMTRIGESMLRDRRLQRRRVEGQRRLQLPGRAAVPAEPAADEADRHRRAAGGSAGAGMSDDQATTSARPSVDERRIRSDAAIARLGAAVRRRAARRGRCRRRRVELLGVRRIPRRDDCRRRLARHFGGTLVPGRPVLDDGGRRRDVQHGDRAPGPVDHARAAPRGPRRPRRGQRRRAAGGDRRGVRRRDRRRLAVGGAAPLRPKILLA